MAAFKEIRNKIASIRKTQKITGAMEKVAAGKMRKAQQRMLVSMPYADKIWQVMTHIANSQVEYKHRYLQPRDAIRRVGYIVVSTDRGLCGGLNNNLFRAMLHEIKNWHSKEVRVDLSIFGTKATTFFQRIAGVNIIAHTTHLGDYPKVADLIGSVKVMLTAYDNGELDRLFIARNEFVNKMVQKPRITQLLPFAVDVVSSEKKNHRQEYIYEDEPKKLLDTLVLRYIETQVYQSIVTNIACEQAARMLSMKNATDNAEELIGELQLVYNKLRQAAITQEIAEIIGGAQSEG
jgi:F-type H+-transporting ATPase subunit gamma